MKIKAEYQITSYQGHALYQCCIKNDPNEEIKDVKIQGKHVAGKNRHDVVAVKFVGCNLAKVPQNFTKIFPNLKYLIILNSQLQELDKEDLAEYKELEVIDIRQSCLLFLPGDIFEGFQNLKYIFIMGKKLSVIEPNILDWLFNLQRAHFEFFDGDEIYQKGTQSYKEFRKGLVTRFCSRNDEFLEDYIKKLEQNVQKFKRINKNVTEKFQRLEASQEVLIDKNNDLIDDVRRSNLIILGYQGYANDLRQEIELMDVNYKKGVFGDLKAFIQDETTKDFKIIINDREFPVHKFLLAARSPTLAEILKNNPEVEKLNLVDISVEIFEIILKFLYTDELPEDDGTNFMLLFAAAGKLKIQELKDFAATKLTSILHENNALEILKLSNKCGHEGLSKKAFDKIKKKYPKINFEDSWIYDATKIEEIIKAFEKKEAELQDLEEKFINLLHGTEI